MVRTHKKWNAFIPTMFHRCLTCVLNVILTDKSIIRKLSKYPLLKDLSSLPHFAGDTCI